MRMPMAALRVGGVLAASAIVGLADAGPSPDKLKHASESFEAGARAFKDEKFEEAAAHFEAADSEVPSPKALRLAIRARDQAGQDARAATLAALALERYPDDAETKQVAEEELAKVGPSLHRVQISCVSPCLLAAAAHIVHGEATTRWVVYLFPGKTQVGASFGKLAAPEQTVTAEKGGKSSLRFSPVPGDVGAAAAAPPKPAPKPVPDATPDSNATDPTVDPAPPEPDSDGSTGISPGFFVAGLIATAGLGATTIWSGVDTLGDPGTDGVRAQCAGQGESCPAYQDGLAKEVRTNALIGATAGVAALTLVFAIVADWGGSPDPADTEESAPTGLSLDVPRMWVGHGSTQGGGAEIRGRF